ncbi:hypothetical protein [Indiicoccus explosivorum]|uniref:hypothetical protein n=1 Tax=Indiicoccus explosivorum TaxID=1917864 RepID=UPI000B42F30C|nr:hypothetical protein [Indiicoccus explosivorum]
MTIVLSHHKTFEHVEEMNETIRIHLRTHRYNLTETAIKALEVISRHAVKYPGAAWLKIDTLAGMIGKSPVTTRRAVALLERLHIVERVAFMRKKSGGNGGNILRVLPAEPIDDRPSTTARADAEKPTAASAEAVKREKETTTPLNQQNTYDTAQSIKRGLTVKLPAVLANTLAPFFDTDELYTAYGVMLRAKASVDRSIAFEHHEDAYRDAVLSVMHAYKRGKVRNLMAVLYRATQRTTKALYVRQLAEEVFAS